MTKVFSNSIGQTETWTASGATLTWSTNANGANFSTLVVQSIQAQYARRITPIWPLTFNSGGAKRINIVGTPSGTLSIQSVIGPNTKSLAAFLQAVGKTCKDAGDAVTLTVQPFVLGCENTSGSDTKYIFKGVELESIGITIQAGELALISQPLSFQFSEMIIE